MKSMFGYTRPVGYAEKISWREFIQWHMVVICI